MLFSQQGDLFRVLRCWYQWGPRKPTLHSVSISRVDVQWNSYAWHTFSPVTPHSNLRSPKDSEPPPVLKTQTQTLFASYSAKTTKTWNISLLSLLCYDQSQKRAGQSN